MDGRRYRRRWVSAVGGFSIVYLLLLSVVMIFARVFIPGEVAYALCVGLCAAALVYAAAIAWDRLDVEDTLRSAYSHEPGGGGRLADLPTVVRSAEMEGARSGIKAILARHDQLQLPGQKLRDQYRTLLELESALEDLEKRTKLAEPQYAEGFAVAGYDFLFRILGALGAAACLGFALGARSLPLGLAAFIPAGAGEVVTRMNDPAYVLRTAMRQIHPSE